MYAMSERDLLSLHSNNLVAEALKETVDLASVCQRNQHPIPNSIRLMGGYVNILCDFPNTWNEYVLLRTHVHGIHIKKS